MTWTIADPRALEPGDVVAVFVRGVWHPGIVESRDDDGMPRMIHCSARVGCVAIEPWSGFVPGERLRVRRQPRPATIDREVVLSRARARLGRPWTLDYSCEHFVRDAHELSPRSVQVGAALATVAGILLRVRGWGM